MTQARSGAPNEAFGRVENVLRQPASAIARNGTFCVRPLIFWLPRKVKAARNTSGSTNGTRTSVERHARAVGVGEVEPGQEEPAVGQAHPVDVVGQFGVGVEAVVRVHHVVDQRTQRRVEQSASSGGS